MATRTNKTAERAVEQPAPSDAESTFLLRTCREDLTAHGGFRWPEKGHVRCPDWKPRAACGNGLHGLLHGKGAFGLLSMEPKAKWLVVRVRRADVVAIDDEKVKVPDAWVEYVGDVEGAAKRLAKLDSEAVYAQLPGAQVVAAGENAQAMVNAPRSQSAARGDYSQSAARGDYSQSAASGYSSQSAASGYSSQSAARGYYSQSAASGYSSQSAASGYSSQSAASGDYSQSAASGDSSQSAARGDYSQSAASGTRTRALAEGTRARARAGELGILILFSFDDAADRQRVVVGYVGENDIKADTWYRVGATGAIEEAPDVDYPEFGAEECAAAARALDAEESAARAAEKAVAAAEAANDA